MFNADGDEIGIHIGRPPGITNTITTIGRCFPWRAGYDAVSPGRVILIHAADHRAVALINVVSRDLGCWNLEPRHGAGARRAVEDNIFRGVAAAPLPEVRREDRCDIHL